jgi:hypothetical protein
MAKELGEDGNCILILKELAKDREKNKRAGNEYELWGKQFPNHGSIERVRYYYLAV